jgi:hypothetical protein
MTQLRPPALETAIKLARLPAEKEEIRQLQERIQAAVEHDRTLTDRSIAPRLDAARRRLALIEDDASRDPRSKETRDALYGLRGEAITMRHEAERASDPVRAALDGLLAAIDNAESTLHAGQEQAEILDTIAKNASHADDAAGIKRYLESLRDYTVRFPKTARSEAIARAINERILWETAVVWESLMQQWAVPRVAREPVEASQRLIQLNDFRTAYKPQPVEPAFSELFRYHEALARLVAADDNPAIRLDKLFSSPIIENTWLLKTKDGSRYYSLEKPRELAAGYHAKVVVSLDGKEEPVFVTNFNFSSVGVAPHSSFAQKIKKRIPNSIGWANRWETAVIDVAHEVLIEPDLDPIVRWTLLDGTIRLGVRGSYSLATAFKDQLQFLDRAGINTKVLWFDSGDSPANLERRRADDALKRFPSLAPCANAALEVRRRLEALASRRYAPAGVALKGMNDRWECRAGARIAAGTALYVILPNVGWQPIGTSDGSAPDGAGLDRQAEPLLEEGRLVFAGRGAK